LVPRLRFCLPGWGGRCFLRGFPQFVCVVGFFREIAVIHPWFVMCARELRVVMVDWAVGGGVRTIFWET